MNKIFKTRSKPKSINALLWDGKNKEEASKLLMRCGIEKTQIDFSLSNRVRVWNDSDHPAIINTGEYILVDDNDWCEFIVLCKSEFERRYEIIREK